VTAARRAGDDSVLAEVLDARLYALWDPAGAEGPADHSGRADQARSSFG
jgi:hypothetical protein